MRTITFNELRKIKDSLPSGSMHRIADELGLHVDTVRNFFGGHNFKEGKVSDFRVIIVCVFPKKAKMLKHSGAFSPGTNRKRFIRRRKSIQLSVGIPGHRNSGGNSYWQRVSVGVGSILLRRISRLTFTPDGAMVSLLTEESRFGNGEGSSVVRG